MAKKDKWGRPTVKTPELVRKLEEILKIDWTITEACSYAWISRDTYYRWLEEDSNFSDKMDKARMYMHIESRKTLVKAIRDDNDTKAAIEFLKRRDKRYMDSTKLSWDEENPLKVTILKIWDPKNKEKGLSE